MAFRKIKAGLVNSDVEQFVGEIGNLFFDIADGAMWNNKMDNILIYHRPNHQKDPSSTLCELHTKKIRRQKSVVGIRYKNFNCFVVFSKPFERLSDCITFNVCPIS